MLSQYQHGFRKNHSTNTNLIYFWDEISSLANIGKEISIIYTDLRKAFDSVPHDLLVLKLEAHGIMGRNIRWLQNYLSYRHQSVIVNGKSSQPILIESGVPQGGVLSGLLFNIYINDMPSKFEYARTYLYADDAKIYAPIPDSESIVKVQKDLDSLATWCAKWRLRLNEQKCFIINYVPQGRSSTPACFSINNVPLEIRQQAMDLGIVITDDLKFHNQVLKACKKATQEINRIRRTFTSRNPSFLRNMFTMFVRPHLEYCVQVWNPEYLGDKSRMEKVQNRFTRLLRHGNVMSPKERNEVLGITTHEIRRLRGDLIYIYKMFTSGLFISSNVTQTRGHSKKLCLERTNNNIRKHSFSVRNILAWNNLHEHVVQSTNLNIFKVRLDDYLKNFTL